MRKKRKGGRKKDKGGRFCVIEKWGRISRCWEGRWEEFQVGLGNIHPCYNQNNHNSDNNNMTKKRKRIKQK